MKLTVTCDLSEEDVERIRGEYEPGLTDAELVEEAVREYARLIGHDQAYRDVLARSGKHVYASEIQAECDTYDAAHPPPATPTKRFPDPAALDEAAVAAERAGRAGVEPAGVEPAGVGEFDAGAPGGREAARAA